MVNTDTSVRGSIFSAYIYTPEEESEELSFINNNKNKMSFSSNSTSASDDISREVSSWDASSSGSNNTLANAAVSVANSMGGSKSTGRCLAGVNRALSQVYGQTLSYPSAYMAIKGLQGENPLSSKFKEVSVSREQLKSLPAGAIVVWDRSAGNPHGHISIALGNGREASDFSMNQMTDRDAAYHVFLPVA